MADNKKNAKDKDLVIAEFLPENLTEKGIEEALLDKQMSDFINAEGDGEKELDAVIDTVVKSEFENVKKTK